MRHWFVYFHYVLCESIIEELTVAKLNFQAIRVKLAEGKLKDYEIVEEENHKIRPIRNVNYQYLICIRLFVLKGIYSL